MAIENPLKTWRDRHPEISLRVLAAHLDTNEAHVCKWLACAPNGKGTLPSLDRRTDIAFVTRQLTGEEVSMASWGKLEYLRRHRATTPQDRKPKKRSRSRLKTSNRRRP